MASTLEPTHERFKRAVEGLVEVLKKDRSIVAAVLCGSLSHDRVWEKSDVDMVIVTVDDKRLGDCSVSLSADGINVHAMLTPRGELRKMAEGSARNSFIHAYLAMGKVLFTHDPTIAQIFERLKTVGERDTSIQLMRAATWALAPIYKAHKWIKTRDDLDYTALWILNAATPLARVEVLSRGKIAGREVILQALELNPDFFRVIYSDLLNKKKSKRDVQAALDAIDRYMVERAATLFAPVLDHLREARDVRSATDLEDYFTRNFGFEGVVAACEYLSDQGMIGKASVPRQLTRLSNVQAQELAFYSKEANPVDEF